MRATVSLGLVAILAVTGSSARLKAESNDVRATLRTSIETAGEAFANSQSAGDAAASAAWTRLTNLAAASRIVIRSRDGQVVHAAFVEADDVSLTARAGTRRRLFARADIVEVTSDPKGSRGGAYLGSFIGFVVGTWVAADTGLGCAAYCSREDMTREWLAFAGAPVGLGFAGYYGLRERPEVIYHAP